MVYVHLIYQILIKNKVLWIHSKKKAIQQPRKVLSSPFSLFSGSSYIHAVPLWPIYKTKLWGFIKHGKVWKSGTEVLSGDNVFATNKSGNCDRVFYMVVEEMLKGWLVYT